MARELSERAKDLEIQVALARELREVLVQVQKLWEESPNEDDVRQLREDFMAIRDHIQEIPELCEELPTADELDELDSKLQSIRDNAESAVRSLQELPQH